MERAIHICMELDDITTVYRRHHRALHAFLARGSRVSHEADDLAQEVYLRLARMGAAAAENSSGTVRYVHYTTSIVVFHPDPHRADQCRRSSESPG